jgi:cobalt-zinc-cadmium efflux system outer membrane protein
MCSGLFKQIVFAVLLSVSLFLGGGGSVWAQPEGEVLTLQEAIRLALQNNPQLRSAQARLGVSEAEVITAGAWINPNLMSDNGIAERTYRVGIEQTFELGGKRRRRMDVARARREVVQTDVDEVALTLRTDVRRAFTTLYYAQEAQNTYRDLVITANRFLEIARRREEAGDIPLVDVLQAEIMAMNYQNSLQITLNDTIEAQNVLNTLLNIPLDQKMPLAAPTGFVASEEELAPVMEEENTTFATLSLDRLTSIALTKRPELLRNRNNRLVSQRELTLAKVSRVPNLAVAAGPDLVTEPGQNKLSAFIMGYLELPVYNRQQGPIQEALARQSMFDQEEVAIRNRIRMEVANAYNATVINQRRIELYESDLLPKARDVIEKAQRSFQEGKSSVLLSIAANESYSTIRLGYLDALQDYQNAVSNLERATATGL